nr:MAG TPA: hypothetical protein [Caudoviricetes sp.]
MSFQIRAVLAHVRALFARSGFPSPLVLKPATGANVRPRGQKEKRPACAAPLSNPLGITFLWSAGLPRPAPRRLCP